MVGILPNKAGSIHTVIHSPLTTAKGKMTVVKTKSHSFWNQILAPLRGMMSVKNPRKK